MQAILEGKFNLKHPCTMVNNWVNNLKRTYDEKKLKEEASKIESPITLESFKNFFKKRRNQLSHLYRNNTWATTKYQHTMNS